MNNRDKLILIGFYLSKYNEDALRELGFNSFQEAFNVLGFSLSSKPSSIKIIEMNLTLFSLIIEKDGIKDQ